MSHASFATFVDAPVSSSRSSRLLFASVIACSSLAVALAFAFTLERMSILRMPGPKTSYELAAVVIAEPPKVAEPPDKPEHLAAEGSEHETSPTSDRRDDASSILETGEPSSRDASPGPTTSGKSGIPSGPPSIGSCPGGICGKGPIGIPTGTGSCSGLKCKQVEAPPPKPVSFSSLGCIACADPNTDALRRTAAGIRKSGGTNVTRFCVDSTGRVEASSVATESSHGDPAIDRLCRDAVKQWRFSPTKVDGEARRACSEATFRITFE